MEPPAVPPKRAPGPRRNPPTASKRPAPYPAGAPKIAAAAASRDRKNAQDDDNDADAVADLVEYPAAVKRALADWGKVYITEAWETIGGGALWLLDTRKPWTELGDSMYSGLVRICGWEHGLVDRDELLQMQHTGQLFQRVVKIFEDALPCTFAQLVEKKPQLITYF